MFDINKFYPQKKVAKKKNLQRQKTSSFEGRKIVSCGFSFLPICSRVVENKADEVDERDRGRPVVFPFFSQSNLQFSALHDIFHFVPFFTWIYICESHDILRVSQNDKFSSDLQKSLPIGVRLG